MFLASLLYHIFVEQSWSPVIVVYWKIISAKGLCLKGLYQSRAMQDNNIMC